MKTDHDLIVEMHTVLLGANGDDGLVGDVHKCEKRISTLERHTWRMLGGLALLIIFIPIAIAFLR